MRLRMDGTELRPMTDGGLMEVAVVFTEPGTDFTQSRAEREDAVAVLHPPAWWASLSSDS